MQRVTRSSNVVALPADPVGEGAGGFFTPGDTGAGTSATIPGYEWFNRIQEEIADVIESTGGALDGADNTQLRTAIVKMIGNASQSVIDETATIEASVVDGEAVLWDAGNSRYDEATADGTANNKMAGFADVTNGEVVLYGETRAGLFSGLTPGAQYYLDGTTPGEITDTAPTDKVRVGIAKTADILFVDIDAEASDFDAGAMETDIRLLFLKAAALDGDRLNIVDGIADPFMDETDIDTVASTNENYNAGGYYRSLVPSTQIPQGTGTAIGNLTLGGGLAAAFDGVTVQAEGASAENVASNPGYIGKDWGVGVTKTISKLIAYGATNGGFSRTSLATVTLKLLGHTEDNPGAATVLYTSTNFTDANGLIKTYESGIDTTTAYRFHWVQIDRGAGTYTGTCAAEIEFFESASVADMTLLSNAFAADTAPDTGRIHLQVKENEVITPNTDLTAKISRDGGTTWTQGVLVLQEILADGTKAYEDANVNISGQPSATSIKYKIKTLNSKDIEIHGVVLQWT